MFRAPWSCNPTQSTKAMLLSWHRMALARALDVTYQCVVVACTLRVRARGAQFYGIDERVGGKGFSSAKANGDDVSADHGSVRLWAQTARHSIVRNAHRWVTAPCCVQAAREHCHTAARCTMHDAHAARAIVRSAKRHATAPSHR